MRGIRNSPHESFIQSPTRRRINWGQFLGVLICGHESRAMNEIRLAAFEKLNAHGELKLRRICRAF
jgi:hypothetical protein